MKTTSFFAITLAALLASSCKPLNLSNSVAVVDLNVVAKSLDRDDLIVKNIQSANDDLNNQLKQIAQDLRNQLQQEKSKLGEKPSKEEEQQYLKLVQKANNQLGQTKQAAIQKSQQIQSSLIAEFRSEVSKVAKEVATKNGFTTVLAVNEGLLWADSTVDITSEVIAEMRYSPYINTNKSNNP
jgi:Skp family chaperone for outer membrane proteins